MMLIFSCLPTRTKLREKNVKGAGPKKNENGFDHFPRHLIVFPAIYHGFKKVFDLMRGSQCQSFLTTHTRVILF